MRPGPSWFFLSRFSLEMTQGTVHSLTARPGPVSGPAACGRVPVCGDALGIEGERTFMLSAFEIWVLHGDRPVCLGCAAYLRELLWAEFLAQLPRELDWRPTVPIAEDGYAL